MVRKERGIKHKKLHLQNEESKYTKSKQGDMGSRTQVLSDYMKAETKLSKYLRVFKQIKFGRLSPTMSVALTQICCSTDRYTRLSQLNNTDTKMMQLTWIHSRFIGQSSDYILCLIHIFLQKENALIGEHSPFHLKTTFLNVYK